jgi:hypothetical protein
MAWPARRAPNADAVMAFNYGGVPLARQTSASSSYYDLERVEVLKGPQGTLYGRNATVGALNLVPVRPKSALAAGMSVTAGNYNTLNTNGYVNTPVTSNLDARIAFQTARHDGYFTNGLDDANNYGARASLLWKPDANLSILFMADAYFNRARGPYSTWRYYMSGTQEWIDPNNPWFGLGAAGSCSNALLCPRLPQRRWVASMRWATRRVSPTPPQPAMAMHVSRPRWAQQCRPVAVHQRNQLHHAMGHADGSSPAMCIPRSTI